jgi:DNA-binding NarL/FixJ family response regulator
MIDPVSASSILPAAFFYGILAKKMAIVADQGVSMADQAKIILVEDHQILREGLRQIMQGEQRFSLVEEFVDGRSFLKRLHVLDADLVILDISLPDMSGLEIIKRIRNRNLTTRLLVLSAHHSARFINTAFHNGADGFVAKDAGMQELFKAMGRVLAGHKFLGSGLSAELEADILADDGNLRPDVHLTRRERQVFELVMRNMKNNDIAETLEVGVKSVEKHKRNIFHKFNVKSTKELHRLECN